MPWEATQGNTRIGQETEEVRGKLGKEPLLWFPWEGTDEAG